MAGQERQRGADGRFKGSRSEAARTVTEDADETPLRPRQCQSYLRTRLAKEFPKIVDGFVNEARNGGCAHMKLTAELLEDEKKEPPRKGTAQKLLEEMGE
jgi:hypothetical protein